METVYAICHGDDNKGMIIDVRKQAYRTIDRAMEVLHEHVNRINKLVDEGQSVGKQYVDEKNTCVRNVDDNEMVEYIITLDLE